MKKDCTNYFRAVLFFIRLASVSGHWKTVTLLKNNSNIPITSPTVWSKAPVKKRLHCPRGNRNRFFLFPAQPKIPAKPDRLQNGCHPSLQDSAMHQDRSRTSRLHYHHPADGKHPWQDCPDCHTHGKNRRRHRQPVTGNIRWHKK